MEVTVLIHNAGWVKVPVKIPSPRGRCQGPALRPAIGEPEGVTGVLKQLRQSKTILAQDGEASRACLKSSNRLANTAERFWESRSTHVAWAGSSPEQD